MANKQINELTEKTTIVDADLIPIYDSEEAGSEKTKKITFANAIGYEEGTWTPVAADANSGGNTGGSSTASGVYTKIGRQVTVQFTLENITTVGLTPGNALFIQGLPFVSSANRFIGNLSTHTLNFSGAWVNLATEVAGGPALWFQDNVDNGTAATIKVSDVTTGTTDIYGTITYFV